MDIEKNRTKIDGKAKVEKRRPSNTNCLDFLLIWGPFWNQNRSKKPSKTGLIFEAHFGRQKKGEKSTPRCYDNHRPTGGEVDFGLLGSL